MTPIGCLSWQAEGSLSARTVKKLTYQVYVFLFSITFTCLPELCEGYPEEDVGIPGSPSQPLLSSPLTANLIH